MYQTLFGVAYKKLSKDSLNYFLADYVAVLFIFYEVQIDSEFQWMFETFELTVKSY